MTLTSFQTAAMTDLHERAALGIYGISARLPTLDASPWFSAIEGIEIDPVIAALIMNGGVK